MRVTLDHIDREAENIYSFWFKTSQPINFLAGQYIELSLPHPNPDKKGINRWFTVSSAPTHTQLVSITTKFSKPKSSSFKATLGKLKLGSSLDMSQPMGDFVLPKDPAIPLVFVAGGIGVTPFHSIIESLNSSRQSRDIKLIYAVRSHEELIFDELFKAARLSLYRVLVDQPDPLSAKQIKEIVGGIEGKLIYIAGPEPMVENLINNFLADGAESSQLIGDYFPNYSNI